jgi:hypothetical protein
MLIPISPHNQQLSFQSEPTAFGTDSAKNGSAQLRTGERDSGDFFSWTPSLPPVGECAGYSSSAESISQPVPLHRPCPHINAAAERLSRMVARSPFRPTLAPITLRHAAEPRSRLTTAGFQSRRREDFAWCHFFPDPSDSALRSLMPRGLSLPHHRCFATTMRLLPFRRIPPGPFAKGGKIPPSFPLQKVFMDRTGTPKLLLRQSLPLAARPQYKDDAFEDFAGLHGFTTTSWTPKISPFFLAFLLWNERFYPLPQFVGHRP